MKSHLEGSGRPAVDFELLFDEWCRSGLPRVRFLENYGVDPKNKRVKAATSHWTAEAKKAHKSAMKKHRNGKVVPARPQRELAELWQMVQAWRKGQAGDDYDTGCRLRRHLDILLDRAFRVLDDGEVESKINTVDLARLAEVALKVQKIQRLALGMTTENVGIPKIEEPETHIASGDEATPIYVVEVNKDGKFVRPKPKQVR